MNWKLSATLAFVWAVNSGIYFINDDPEDNHIGYMNGGVSLMWAGLAGYRRREDQLELKQKNKTDNNDRFDIM